jgi:hypothetical protein
MAKYSRFDPRNKKQKRTEKVTKIKKVKSDDEVEQYIDKYGMTRVLQKYR